MEPPETSVLTLHWPDGPGRIESTLSYPQIFAADGTAVLFPLILGDNFPSDVVNYFVYQASSDLLAVAAAILVAVTNLLLQETLGYAGCPTQQTLQSYATGVVSDGEEGFHVGDLMTRKDSPRQLDIYKFQ